ncbi:solute carrier organic anion transporter family member 4C1-like [Amphiura filiformis]|uniref:solute carrier organic anion transporter family member 4C1-like n=1 Tax=Amphiura filiformis TaxID=82378 RepID=UPI003B20BB04
MELASIQSIMINENGNQHPTTDSKISHEHDGDPVDTNLKCGWFSCRPDCLHYFNNPRWLLFWTCLWSLTAGMAVNGLTNVSITSIERRFELSSSKSALIPGVYEIPSSIFTVLVGYFGAHGSKPRWLAIGAILQGIGCIIFTLPHFLTDIYIPEQSSSITNLCGEHNSTHSCTNNDEETISSVSSNLYIFLIGQLMLGLGSSSSVLIMAFIDESVKDKVAGMYLGIAVMFTTLGPALGYIIGGITIDILYTDFPSVDPSSFDIDASSHQWIGAWWLGFLICGLLLLLNAVSLSCFPPQLPGTHDFLAERKERRHAVEGLELASKPGFGQGIDDVPLATKLLFKNPIFILLTVNVVCEAIFLTGAEVFIPKFIEQQFGLSAGDASVAVGISATLSGCSAMIVSGWLIKRFRLTIPAMLKMNLGSMVICTISLSGLFLRCEEQRVAGVNVQYPSNVTYNEFPSLDASCNTACNCSTDEFLPVCGSNGIVFFSSCHAGCTNYTNEEYANCSCIVDTDNDSTATDGFCGKTCTSFYIFMIFLSTMIFTFSFCETPLLITLLRCVPESLRAYALGIEGFAGRLLGGLPGPIIMGLLIDNGCILWHEECGEIGKCWFHDRDIVSRNIFLFAVTLKIVVIGCYVVAIKCYRPVGEKSKYQAVPAVEL